MAHLSSFTTVPSDRPTRCLGMFMFGGCRFAFSPNAGSLLAALQKKHVVSEAGGGPQTPPTHQPVSHFLHCVSKSQTMLKKLLLLHPPPRPRLFLLLFCSPSHLRRSPLLCCISLCLSEPYSSLRPAAAHASCKRISITLCSFDIILPPRQLLPREASSLVSRLLLQQQGQACSRGIDRAARFSPSPQDLNSSPVAQRNPQPLRDGGLLLSCDVKKTLAPISWSVSWMKCHAGEATNRW